VVPVVPTGQPKVASRPNVPPPNVPPPALGTVYVTSVVTRTVYSLVVSTTTFTQLSTISTTIPSAATSTSVHFVTQTATVRLPAQKGKCDSLNYLPNRGLIAGRADTIAIWVSSVSTASTYSYYITTTTHYFTTTIIQKADTTVDVTSTVTTAVTSYDLSPGSGQTIVEPLLIPVSSQTEAHPGSADPSTTTTSTGIPTSRRVGIGLGAGLGGVALLALLGALLWKLRSRRVAKTSTDSSSSNYSPMVMTPPPEKSSYLRRPRRVKRSDVAKHHHHEWTGPQAACEDKDCMLNREDHTCRDDERETCPCTCRDEECVVARRLEDERLQRDAVGMMGTGAKIAVGG
jgi:hypothetical protein